MHGSLFKVVVKVHVSFGAACNLQSSTHCTFCTNSRPREFHYVSKLSRCRNCRICDSHKLFTSTPVAHEYRPCWSKGAQAVLKLENGAPGLGCFSNEIM